MLTVTAPDPLPDDPVALQALVRGQRERIAELEQRLAWFLVQYRLAQHRRFAPSTETTVHQLDLFADLLAEARPDGAPPTPVASPVAGDPDVGLPATARGHGGRRPLPASLPRERSCTTWPMSRKSAPAVGKPVR